MSATNIPIDSPDLERFQRCKERIERVLESFNQ